MMNYMVYDSVLAADEVMCHYNIFWEKKTIPIKEAAMLLKIGPGKNITIDGEDYIFLPDMNDVLEKDKAINYADN